MTAEMHEDPQGDPEKFAPNPRPMLAWARRLLDETWTLIAQNEDRSTAGGRNIAGRLAAVQAMGTLAQAAALLQPTPEEVLAAYEDVSTEVDGEAAGKLEKVYALLSEANRTTRRHPAIIEAIKLIEEGT